VSRSGILGYLVNGKGGIELFHISGVGMTATTEPRNFFDFGHTKISPRIADFVHIFKSRIAAVTVGAGETRLIVDIIGPAYRGSLFSFLPFTVTPDTIIVIGPDHRKKQAYYRSQYHSFKR
jgi:hypothetical protein